MTDFARELFERSVAAPYRTKVVEKLRLPPREERERILAERLLAGVSGIPATSSSI
jgi:hypothetical protein